MSKTYRDLPAYVTRIQGIRYRNAAGKHMDRRTRRVRTRSAALQKAIAESRA